MYVGMYVLYIYPYVSECTVVAGMELKDLAMYLIVLTTVGTACILVNLIVGNCKFKRKGFHAGIPAVPRHFLGFPRSRNSGDPLN